MKRLFGIFMCISAFLLLFSSCANTYYCTLNSRGVSPAEKTYYVAPQDSTLKYSLEFKEYAEILEEHLNSAGYIETNSKTAALRIELGYGTREAYLESSSNSSETVTNIYNNVNITSKSTPVASADRSSPNYGNYNITYTVPIGGTGHGAVTHTYKIPLYVVIRAFETITNEPVWEVVVEDDLDRETQMQNVMPWLLLAAKDYFGRNSKGEQEPRIRNTAENREIYQLVWPY